MKKYTNNIMESKTPLEKLDVIFDSTNNLQSIVDTIQSKIKSLNKVYLEFQMKKTIHSQSTSGFLKFQTELLSNEYSYYKRLRNILTVKLYNEVYEIYDGVKMILTSIDNLEIDDCDRKNELMKRVKYTKKPSFVDSAHMKKIVENTLTNIKVINDYLQIFDTFIKNTHSKNKKQNNHCNNLVISLKNKRYHIFLEYQKYKDELEELIDYFHLLCDKVNQSVAILPLQEALIDSQAPDSPGIKTI